MFYIVYSYTEHSAIDDRVYVYFCFFISFKLHETCFVNHLINIKMVYTIAKVKSKAFQVSKPPGANRQLLIFQSAS